MTMTETQLAGYAKEIQAEFNLRSNEEMTSHKISGATNPALEERVFQVANKVALKFAALHWSNFHTWELFRNCHNEEEARQHASQFLDSAPFSTCLGMASGVTVALQETLRRDADVSAYSERVQLVIDIPLEEFKKSAAPRFHCITITVADYIFPLARATRTTPFGDMPGRGTIYARAVWNYAPASPYVEYAPLGNGKFLVNTLTLKIDIIEQKMVVQFPYADWLEKPNNAWFLHSLRQRAGFKRCAKSLQDAVAYFDLPLGTGGFDLAVRGLSAGTVVWLRTLDSMCAALGMPRGEVLRIADVVVEIWKEALVQYAKKSSTEAEDSVMND